MFRNTSSPAGPSGPRRELVLSHRGVLAAILGIVILLATALGAEPAFGHWSASGIGNSTAIVATLAPPTNVSASSAWISAGVPVSWNASAGPLRPAGYYVTRITTNTTPMPACGSGPAALITATSCTDAAPAGEHAYLVTAVYRSWTAVSTPSKTVDVVISLNKTLTFTSQPANLVTAGSDLGTLRVVARNVWGGAQRNVRVTISFGANPGGGTISGLLYADTNDQGVATFGQLKINKAGAGYSLIASSEDYVGDVSSSFTVKPAASSQLVVTSPTSLSGIASATANIGPMTLERRDMYGNPTSVGEPALTLYTNPSVTGQFATTVGGTNVTSLSIPAGSASASFYYGNRKMGTTSLQFGAVGLTAPQAISVTITAAAPSKLAFAAPTGPFPKNKSFNVTVQVVDAFDNLTPSEPLVGIQAVNQKNCSLNVSSQSIRATAGAATFLLTPPNGNHTGCQLTASSDGFLPVSTVFDIT